MKLLLTGAPGIGKTTIIMKVLEELQVEGGGFYTEELRQGRRRVGFVVKDLEGREGLLAHVDLAEGPRVGKYRVDVRSFEEVAIPALEEALREKDLVVIDEIGKMELFSERFRELVQEALRGPKDVLGVIHKGHDPFSLSLREIPGVRIWEVTLANRDQLPQRIAEELKKGTL